VSFRVLVGDRVARGARIVFGCEAAVFDARGCILLIKRRDNGQWCLPGGSMDAGESAPECALRELREETGLEGRVTGLITVYSSPHRVVVYDDGSRSQVVGLLFAVEAVGGRLEVTAETTAFGYFSATQVQGLDLVEGHRERIADAFAPGGAPYLR
jgi:ADP-ribose pyrophosphatase YjhB (NUDIX family)